MAILLGAAAAPEQSPVDALAGRYSKHFQNGLVSGEVYWSDDVVEIVPTAPDAAYVRVSLQFYNGHVCELSGVADAVGSRLVYLEQTPVVSGAPLCKLSLSRRGSDLLIDDEQGSCKAYCGARGGLTGQSLPLRSRRPITYVARLKASQEFQKAVADWRQRHGLSQDQKPNM